MMKPTGRTLDTPVIPREPRWRFASRTKSVEWLMTAFMLGWGLTLAMPGDTFSLPPYKNFKFIGLDETDVSIFYLSLGFVRAWTLWRNGAIPLGPEIRFFCSLVGAFTWLMAAILFLIPVFTSAHAPVPVIASTNLVMYGGEMYAIGVAAFDRARSRR